MNYKERPILDIDGQIAHLQSKGVKFEIMSIDEARQYLSQNNNYFKLRAYRKNFPKHPGGSLEDQYINLDFAMLKDLAIIDMRLRYAMLHLCLDIEHFAKVKLLQAVESSGNDGYKIVEDYKEYLKITDETNNHKNYTHLKHELERNINNPYCGGIIQTYGNHYPVWAFVEIIPLGSFINFYGFCAKQFCRKDMDKDYYLLLQIKKLRNAAAHNNCIINDMGAKKSTHKTDYAILHKLNSISKATRNTRLSNIRMQQMITLLYMHTTIVTSQGVHDHQKTVLNELCERMFKHIDYYTGNDAIVGSFEFFKKSVDIFFS